jgi:hypothetical protein
MNTMVKDSLGLGLLKQLGACKLSVLLEELDFLQFYRLFMLCSSVRDWYGARRPFSTSSERLSVPHLCRLPRSVLLHIVAAGCETVHWCEEHYIALLSLSKHTFTTTSALEQSLKNAWTLWPAAVTYICMGHTVALLIWALRYGPEGREFDFRWYHASMIRRAALWPWSRLSL